MMSVPTPAPVPRLLAVVDLGGDRKRRHDWLASAAGAGVPVVWSRDRVRPDTARLANLEALAGAGLRALSAGRADLCWAGGAAGVHLSSDDISVAEVRRLLGFRALVGRSTHCLGEVAAAAEEGADYVVFGPVWPTPGKGPALGIQSLREASQLGVPVLALGGVDAQRVADAAAAGAWGVAGIRCCAEPNALAGITAAVLGAFGSLDQPRGSTIIPP